MKHSYTTRSVTARLHACPIDESQFNQDATGTYFFNKLLGENKIRIALLVFR
jgi:hypothetical protein